MLTGIYLSCAILVIGVVFYAVDSWLIHRYDKLRTKESGSSRSISYAIFAIFIVVLLILQPILWPWLGFQTTAAWGLIMQIIGMVIVLAALALHWWARTTLRQYYSEREEVQSEQKLVYAGPYVYIRHPIYTSYFTSIIGLLLINPTVITLLIAIYVYWDYGIAVGREEKLLAEKLPGYADYMKRTTRFFPRIFPPSNK